MSVKRVENEQKRYFLSLSVCLFDVVVREYLKSIFFYIFSKKLLSEERAYKGDAKQEVKKASCKAPS